MRHSDKILQADEVRSYQDIVESCEHLARSVFCDLITEKGITIDELVVIVAPCVGSPGGAWKFIGDARDFIAITLYELGRVCQEKRFNEIILDLTHGINFMPSICMYITQLLASLLMITHEINEVKVKIYNSDPYPPTSHEKECPTLRLNLILKQEVRNVHVPHTLPRFIVRPTEKIDDQWLNSIMEQGKRLMEHIQAVISSFYYPLPLALCKSVEDMIESKTNIKEIFVKFVNLWKDMIHIDAKGKIVKRGLRLVPEAVYSGFLALSLIERVKDKTGESINTTVENLQSLGNLYKLVHESNYQLIVNEIGKIQKRMKDKSLKQCLLKGGRVLLSLLHGFAEKRTPPNTRIMIAHAGLQKDFTIISKDGKIDYDTKILSMLCEKLHKDRIKNVRDLLGSAGLLLPLKD